MHLTKQLRVAGRSSVKTGAASDRKPTPTCMNTHPSILLKPIRAVVSHMLATKLMAPRKVAGLVERMISNHEVAGESPAARHRQDGGSIDDEMKHGTHKRHERGLQVALTAIDRSAQDTIALIGFTTMFGCVFNAWKTNDISSSGCVFRHEKRKKDKREDNDISSSLVEEIQMCGPSADSLAGQ